MKRKAMSLSSPDIQFSSLEDGVSFDEELRRFFGFYGFETSLRFSDIYDH